MQKYPSEHPDIEIWKRLRMCDRKQSFATFQAALAFIRNPPTHPFRWKPRIYQCWHCGGFHFTSAPKHAPKT